MIENETASSEKPQSQQYKWEIVWRNVFLFIFLHTSSLIGVYLLFTATQWKTLLWCYLLITVTTLGIAAGAHRFWSHRAFKATLPLRIILAILQTAALQNDIYVWVRDHRVHHKYTDTDADPHNARRGFFFSHMGWLLIRKHKDVTEKGKNVDMSDILADPVVRFQRKYYLILTPILTFFLPAWVPWYFWNEHIYVAAFVVAILRYTLQLHGTWLVNSAAHIWGTRPYDKNIQATENVPVALISLGEGWHNYHHVFPWDYKASELGSYRVNLNATFIELMAKIGWAYDLKTVPEEVFKQRMNRTGDLSFRNDDRENHEELFWGWDDKDFIESGYVDSEKIPNQDQTDQE